MQLNTCYHSSAEEFLSLVPDDFIDLTVTSPPYDGLRTYNGFSFSVDTIVRELYRATKPGGVCVWIVADQSIQGSETGTSFRHALAFMGAGWNLHDTMIYRKLNPMPRAGRRYHQAFEYMFVFSKGAPKTVNVLTRPRRDNDTRKTRKKKFSRLPDGTFRTGVFVVREQVRRDNVWEYTTGGGHVTKDKIAYRHPAIFPEGLAADHITSWSNPGELVCDVFAGSGTTFKMAKLLSRQFVGSEISAEYCSLIEERLRLADTATPL